MVYRSGPAVKRDMEKQESPTADLKWALAQRRRETSATIFISRCLAYPRERSRLMLLFPLFYGETAPLPAAAA